MDGTVVATNYSTGAVYIPGDTSTHTFVVRAINGTCHTDSAGASGSDATAPTPPAITSIADADACAASGIQVYYASSVELLFSSGLESMTGWSQGWPEGTSSGAWSIEGEDFHPVCYPYDGDAMAMFNSYTATDGDQTLLYRTTGFNIANSYVSVSLTFWMFHDSGNPEDWDGIVIQISTDGTNWEDVDDYYRPIPDADHWGWVQHTVDISAYMGNSNVQIGFLGVSAHGGNMYIDDVSVTGVPVASTTSYNLLDNGSVVRTDTSPAPCTLPAIYQATPTSWRPSEGRAPWTAQALCMRTGTGGGRLS